MYFRAWVITILGSLFFALLAVVLLVIHPLLSVLMIIGGATVLTTWVIKNLTLYWQL